MKCRSVACIWSGTPPSHRITAAAVLKEPPTLYTGGSDGSIIWWSLSSADPDPESEEFSFGQEIKPIAMLCGHAANIADLGICCPVVGSGNEKPDSSCDSGVSCTSDSYGALMSVCTDGVMCVWSRSSGHCRRRRKLPPWVGTPSMVRTLPSNARYVCIGCSLLDTVHLSDHLSTDSIEGSEELVDRESHHRRLPKCAVVIVDTYNLMIVQTVFHGSLSIGSLKFMAIASSMGHKGKHSVVMVDSSGRLQLVPILKDPHLDRDGGAGLHKSVSQLEMNVWADGLCEGGQVVSIATCGNVIAFVLKNQCIFRLLSNGTRIGEISFVDSLLCLEGNSMQSHLIGGMFLESEDSGSNLSAEEIHGISTTNFMVWNNKGYAVVNAISFLNNLFRYEPLCEIHAASHTFDVRSSIRFIQLNNHLLCIESHCVYVEEHVQWKPHFTLWSLHSEHDDSGKVSWHCRMHGKSSFFVDWIASSTSPHEIEGSDDGKNKLNSHQASVPSPICVDNMHTNYESDEGRIVSSSMVISDNCSVPFALVYGFFSGEVEVMRFNLFPGVTSPGNSPHHEVGSHVSRQYYQGHTGAVLCLAAHRMVSTSKGWGFKQVLISGSMDCTVRIWDLDTGNLITTMHQHVAPVHQIILPPSQTDYPWSDCFLSIGEDSCVALASLETLRVERMFPGHPSYPAKVVWDGVRGYIACLCRNYSGTSDASGVLYIWDVKTGARERVLWGTASHSMFDHFCKGISTNSMSAVLNGNTSVSLLNLPVIEDVGFSNSSRNNKEKLVTSSNVVPSIANIIQTNTSDAHASKGNSAKPLLTNPSILQNDKPPIKCYCPFPGIATLTFDLESLMFLHLKGEHTSNSNNKLDGASVKEQVIEKPSPRRMNIDDGSDVNESVADSIEELDWIKSFEECLLRFSLSFLHLWNVDRELDDLLINDMKLKRPENLIVASGFLGDKGSLTLTFPGLDATLELWKSSSEFCAMRSLAMVSLAQRMISLSHFSSAASSALAAFYARNFAEKNPDLRPPLLQLLVSFWQDESEHIRMASRSLFHCAASRAIPLPLCSQKAADQAKVSSQIETRENDTESLNVGGASANRLHADQLLESQGISQVDESKILDWLESFEMQDWISCVGGTSQDAMTSHIIVAAALAIWYPSLVMPGLAMLVVHPLVKLVMAMNEKYSSTAAELLAEGMESTWKACLGSEIPRLVGDIFFQVECVSGSSANPASTNPVVPVTIRETLVGILLPSLAMADIPGFLSVIESQIWSTASDSPVHVVSLMTLVRVVRGSPRNLVQYLDKVVNFILQTMDPSNSVMRKTCFQSSVTALKEVARVFPMVALNDTWTRLAVGDVIGEISNTSIRVYDMQSVMKINVLDASGPPGLPSLLATASEPVATTAISALSFSPDGKGLVAFSEHGLMIRWWSLGSVWWEKLNRSFVPVQCTKLIFVPPWEGFSPNSSRSSIMASIMGNDKQVNLQENASELSHADNLKLLIHNLDLSYRLQWAGDRKVLLTRHGLEIGTFQL